VANGEDGVGIVNYMEALVYCHHSVLNVFAYVDQVREFERDSYSDQQEEKDDG